MASKKDTLAKLRADFESGQKNTHARLDQVMELLVELRRGDHVEDVMSQEACCIREPDPGAGQFCRMPFVGFRPIAEGVSPNRARLIRALEKKWVNGTQLVYEFLPGGDSSEMATIRQAFEIWEENCGISFVEASGLSGEDTHIRISFVRGDGAWSYVGRDVLTISQSEATMNFGWFLSGESGLRTAVHEIGHTLGFHHEHQNPNGGIVWNEANVIADLSGPPNNWSESVIRWNVLRKIDPASVDGSLYDKDSVMHYGLPAGWVASPEELRGGWNPRDVISEGDIQTVGLLYPKQGPPIFDEVIEGPWQMMRFGLGQGEELAIPVEPSDSGWVTFETKGGLDTLLVLQDDQGNTLAADDDSGGALQAKVSYNLAAGESYELKVRLYAAWQEDTEIGLITWR